MCLITLKKTKIKVAKHDIKCYKLVKMVDGHNVRSTIRQFPYKIGKVYKGKLIEERACDLIFADIYANDMFNKSGNDMGDMKVFRVGFHSYNSIKRTKESDFANYEDIVECVIPKGSRYINDQWGMRCSDSIIIKKVINY